MIESKVEWVTGFAPARQMNEKSIDGWYVHHVTAYDDSFLVVFHRNRPDDDLWFLELTSDH